MAKRKRAAYHREYRSKNLLKMKEQGKLYYIKNKERISQYNKSESRRKRDRELRKKYYKENPERFKSSVKKYRDNNIEKVRLMDKSSNLKRTWGITLEEKEKIMLSQNNCCAICLVSFDKIKIVCIDHNHVTGKVRNLLCVPCNAGIGNFKENINILKSAITYIEEWEKKSNGTKVISK